MNSMLVIRVRQWTSCVLLFLVIGASGQQLPHTQLPDENAPNTKSTSHQASSKDVDEKLRKAFDSKNAAYADSNIQAAVDDQSVTLTGTVKSQMQREMALQLAHAYAGDRRIIDKLVVHE